jgi:chromosome segregation ATPase
MTAYDRETMRLRTRVRNMTPDEVAREYRADDSPVVSALAQFVEDVSTEVAGLEADIEALEKEADADCSECEAKEAHLEKIEDDHADALDKKDEEIAHLNTRIEEFAAESAAKSQRITELENTMVRTIEDRLTDIENTLARVVLMLEAREGDPVAKPADKPAAKTEKPKADKPKAETPKPVEEAKDVTLTIEDLRNVFMEAVKVSGKDPAKDAVLENAPGAKKLPDVAPEHYQAVFDALSALAQREAA